MKKIFTLRGVSNTGKSTKVKAVAKWLFDNYFCINHGVDFSKHDICGVLQIGKLKIAFISAGDDLKQIKQIDGLLENHTKIIEGEKFVDIDIIINSCRTKGEGRRYLQNNFNRNKGWLTINIFVEKFNPTSIPLETKRDKILLDEIKTWLIGVEKF